MPRVYEPVDGRGTPEPIESIYCESGRGEIGAQTTDEHGIHIGQFSLR